MSYRKKELIKLANVLLEQRYLIEQTAHAPAPPAPAPTTTTTTTIKIEKDELEVIVDCSSGKFNVDEKTWVKTEVGGYTVYTDPNPPKPGTTQLRCKKEK